MNEVSTIVFERPVDIPRTCSDEALCEAVEMWLLAGDRLPICQKLGIDETMFLAWTRKRGWQELVEKARPRNREATLNGLTRCQALALIELEDRIRYGDKVMITGLDGEVTERREPLPAWKLNSIVDKISNRRELLEDRIEGKTPGSVTSMDVKTLVHALELVARKKLGQTVIEGELGS